MTKTGKGADLSPGEAAIVEAIRESIRDSTAAILVGLKGIRVEVAKGNRERREDSRLVLAEIAEGNRKRGAAA